MKLSLIKGEKHRLWLGKDGSIGYDTYAHKLLNLEQTRRSPNNIKVLEIYCKYCGTWFRPSNQLIGRRLKNKNYKGNLYCSQECKRIRSKILRKESDTICKYSTYAHQISWCEEVRRAPDDENILEVKCKYCGKWFKPTRVQLKNRIKGISNKITGEGLLYCSDECKQACPIYYRHKYPKGFTGDINSSREVQPELRKLVLERDNYTCQKCGLNSNEQCVILHCHHINPVILDPLESADIDNCITLCIDCHYEAHQKDGCRYNQLANCINL